MVLRVAPRLMVLLALAIPAARCGPKEDGTPAPAASSAEAERDLTRRLDDLTKRVAALEEGLKACREDLERMRDADGTPAVRLPSPRVEPAEQPILEGRVVAADNRADVVVISRGPRTACASAPATRSRAARISSP